MPNETYSRASELLYQGRSVKGQDYNNPASFPLFATTSFTMNSLAEIKYIIYGLLLIVAMIFFPGGICKLPEKVRSLVADRKSGKTAAEDTGEAVVKK